MAIILKPMDDKASNEIVKIGIEQHEDNLQIVANLESDFRVLSQVIAVFSVQYSVDKGKYKIEFIKRPLDKDSDLTKCFSIDERGEISVI